jgi:regulator of protease activity HflC (stomatin/prohibitin superfamily)
MLKEIERRVVNGFVALAALVVASGAVIVVFATGVTGAQPGRTVIAALAAVVVLFAWGGLFSVQPNQAKALTLFGAYKGSVKTAGLWWTNPFYAKRGISLRVRNFQTAELKVNDKSSNPIEIGAIVVWQVVDTAEALFAVDNFQDYVKVQSESAVRALASSYPYDAHSDDERSLSHNAAEISDQLTVEVQARLDKAGMKVLETRIAHLAYAPEIANAMLRRQQASAVIAARTLIVEGAVSMVDMALKSIVERGMVQLDDERKATMISNLLVTLCAEQPMQPVVNAGSIY